MANNPYVNKVEYAGQTVMDITDTTAEASGVESGKVFYAANGQRKVGTGMLNYIDDTAGSGDTNKTWSADKLVKKIGTVGSKDLQTQVTELDTKIPKIISFDKTVTIPDSGYVDIYILNETGGNSPVGAFVKLGNNYPLPYFSGSNRTYVELLNNQYLRINGNVAGWGSQTVHITLYFA